MIDKDRETGINPYQPPPLVAEDSTVDFAFAGINLELEDRTPVPFSGSANLGDLNQFLRSYERVSLLPVGTGLLFVLLFQLWALIISPAFALIVAGGVLVVLLTIITSTQWYRTAVFRSSHPTWTEFVEGELTTAGVRIKRHSESAFYRWSWFSGVVIADGMVGFIPGEASEMPVLVSSTMLPESVTFARLKSFARSAKVIFENEMTDATIAWANRQVMRESNRQRAISPPAGAIAIEGPVRGHELNAISRQPRQGSRPVRAHVIRGLLLLAVTLVVAGFFATLATLDPMAFLVIIALTVLVAIFLAVLFQRRSAQSRGERLLYYLIGYATDEGITTDFFVAVTTIPWSNLIVLDESSDRVLLQHKSSTKRLIVRQDMCAGSSQWQDLLEKIRVHTSAGSAGDALSSHSA